MEIIGKFQYLLFNSYQSVFVRKVAILVTSSGATQVVILLTAPILSRTYSPEEFGCYGVYLAILSVGGVFATLRYERGLMIAKSKSERHGVFVLIIFIAFTFALLTFITLSVFPQSMLSLLSYIDRSDWRRLLTFGLFLTAIYTALRFLVLKEGAYRTLSIVQFGTSFTLVLSQLTLSFWNKESGLLLGHVFTYFFVVLVVFKFVIKNKWLDFHKYSVTNLLRIRKAAARNSEYPKYMTWSALCNSTTPQVIMLISSFLFAPAAVGQIFLAERILKRPTLLLGRAISDSSFEEATNKSLSVLDKLYKSRLKTMLLIGAVPFSVLFVTLPFLFPFIFGESWKEAGIYGQILVPSIYLQFVFSPFIPFFTVLRAQKIYLCWSVGRLLIVMAGITIGAWVGNISGAVAGYSAALSIGYIFVHILLLSILHQDAHHLCEE